MDYYAIAGLILFIGAIILIFNYWYNHNQRKYQ